jgi:hypothetical protein
METQANIIMTPGASELHLDRRKCHEAVLGDATSLSNKATEKSQCVFTMRQ